MEHGQAPREVQIADGVSRSSTRMIERIGFPTVMVLVLMVYMAWSELGARDERRMFTRSVDRLSTAVGSLEVALHVKRITPAVTDDSQE